MPDGDDVEDNDETVVGLVGNSVLCDDNKSIADEDNAVLECLCFLPIKLL